MKLQKIRETLNAIKISKKNETDNYSYEDIAKLCSVSLKSVHGWMKHEKNISQHMQSHLTPTLKRWINENNK